MSRPTNPKQLIAFLTFGATVAMAGPNQPAPFAERAAALNPPVCEVRVDRKLSGDVIATRVSPARATITR